MDQDARDFKFELIVRSARKSSTPAGRPSSHNVGIEEIVLDDDDDDDDKKAKLQTALNGNTVGGASNSAIPASTDNSNGNNNNYKRSVTDEPSFCDKPPRKKSRPSVAFDDGQPLRPNSTLQSSSVADASRYAIDFFFSRNCLISCRALFSCLLVFLLV